MSPGHYEAAVQYLDRAIAIDPQLAAAYLNRGLARRHLGQWHEALSDFDRTSALDPALTSAFDERGRIFLERGQTERAAQEFSQSLTIAPTASGFYQRGQLFQTLGQHEKALADFDSAIAQLAEAPFVYHSRAAAKRALGDIDGAHADQEIASRLELGQQP